MRNTLKILHIADLHLGRWPTSGKLDLTYEKASARREEAIEVLEKALAFGRENEVEVIIIAGDLWEADQLNVEEASEIIRLLEGVQLPIVVAPGNHDPYDPISYYDRDALFQLTGRKWPFNLKVIPPNGVSLLTIPELEGVRFLGVAYTSQTFTQRLFTLPFPDLPPFEGITIGIFHATRQGIPLAMGKFNYLPFTDQELLTLPVDYVALGHYHSFSTIKDDEGRIKGAYPGALVGWTLQENGKRGAIWGIVERGGIREDPDRFQLNTGLDRRRVVRLEFDITPIDDIGTLEQALRSEIVQQGVRPSDIVYIELTGIWRGEGGFHPSPESLAEVAWHITLDTEGVAFFSGERLEELARGSDVVGEFVKRMLQLKEQARGNPTQLNRIEKALEFGLLALHNHISLIKPPVVDLEETRP